MSRRSVQHWNELLHGYRAAVLAEYPNPARKNCPGTEALWDLAERIPDELQKDLRWKHALQCGPCYDEYIALRDKI
jgi:hypothetical protein